MMMATAGLLASTPHPTDDEIERALTGNLCRCGTHLRILRAVKRAAGTTA
jgi:nicotinate dehydrogenase subunit A